MQKTISKFFGNIMQNLLTLPNRNAILVNVAIENIRKCFKHCSNINA